MSKLTERVVTSQLIEHVTNSCPDENMQSAYKQFHSTETALVKVFNDIAIDIDSNRVVILLLLDLSAAFDTVDHSILLNRLAYRFGLRGTALAWFESYLTDRSNFVCIRGVRSATRSLSCVVTRRMVVFLVVFLRDTTPTHFHINHSLSLAVGSDVNSFRMMSL